MEGLSFQEAFKYLLQGKKIRRESFLSDTYWVLDEKGNILYVKYKTIKHFADVRFAEPLDVNDWEVIE